MPRTMNGHPIAFHLDSRLTKLEARWKTIQLLQDELLDRFNSEHSPVWIQHDEEPDPESSPPSQLLMP